MRLFIAGVVLLLIGAALWAYRGEAGLLANWSIVAGGGLILLSLVLRIVAAWNTRGRLARRPPDHT